MVFCTVYFQIGLAGSFKTLWVCLCIGPSTFTTRFLNSWAIGEPLSWHLVVLDLTPCYFQAFHDPFGFNIHVCEPEDLPLNLWTYYVLNCAPKLCVDESVGGGIELNTVFMGMLYTVVEGSQFDLKNL